MVADRKINATTLLINRSITLMVSAIRQKVRLVMRSNNSGARQTVRMGNAAWCYCRIQRGRAHLVEYVHPQHGSRRCTTHPPPDLHRRPVVSDRPRLTDTPCSRDPPRAHAAHRPPRALERRAPTHPRTHRFTPPRRFVGATSRRFHRRRHGVRRIRLDWRDPPGWQTDPRPRPYHFPRWRRYPRPLYRRIRTGLPLSTTLKPGPSQQRHDDHPAVHQLPTATRHAAGPPLAAPNGPFWLLTCSDFSRLNSG